MRFLAVFLILFLNTSVVIANTSTTYVVGALAIRGDKLAIQRWQPTIDYLSATTPYSFKLQTLTLDEIELAVQSRKVHFVLTNPANFVVLQKRQGLSAIASFTYSALYNGVSHESNKFSAVIFTRDKNGLNTLHDLQGKKFGAVHANAFGGWWMAWNELLNNGIDPYKNFQYVKFYGFPQDQIVFAVLKGELDAGTVRTGVLESLADAGLLDIAQIKVLSSQSHPNFPLLHSTDLYPEWAFAVAPGINNDVAKTVAKKLYEVPENHETLQKAKITSWTVPPNYIPVRDLMQQLNVGQYAKSNDFTFTDILYKYWAPITTIVVILLGYLVFLLISSSKANKLLKQGKDTATKSYNKYKEANQHLEIINKVKTKLLSNLNNELKAPLNAIICFLHPVKDNISLKHPELQYAIDGIEEAAYELKSVIYGITDTLDIHDFRDKPTFTPINIKNMIHDLYKAFSGTIANNFNKFEIDIDGITEEIVSDPILVNKLLFNLLQQANRGTRHGNIKLNAHCIEANKTPSLEINIIDNGYGLQKSFVDQLMSENHSQIELDINKNINIGNSLYACKRICEKLGGTMHVVSNIESGTEVKIRLPIEHEIELLAS